MPSHCAALAGEDERDSPCGGAAGVTARVCGAVVAGSEAAGARSAMARASSATKTARCESAARWRAAVAQHVVDRAERRRCRGARRRSRRGRAAPAGDAAESAATVTPRAGVTDAPGAVGGASSSTTCALVPVMPKALTPAKRGRPSPRSTASHAAGCRGAARPRDRRVRLVQCRLGGIASCSRASTP